METVRVHVKPCVSQPRSHVLHVEHEPPELLLDESDLVAWLESLLLRSKRNVHKIIVPVHVDHVELAVEGVVLLFPEELFQVTVSLLALRPDLVRVRFGEVTYLTPDDKDLFPLRACALAMWKPPA